MAARPAGFQENGKQESAPRSPREIEKDMKSAYGVQNFSKIWNLVQEAAGLKNVDAYKLIIRYALHGDDRDLERRTFLLLIKVTDPSIRKLMYQEARKNSNYKTRIILLGVAFQQQDDPEAFRVIQGAVLDSNPRVAVTAVKYLRRTGDANRAVPMLIKALEKAEHRRNRFFFDIQNALTALTGATMETAEDWKKFWEVRKTGKKATAREKSPTRARKASFFTVSVETDRVLFMIDVSGSMLKKDQPPVKKEVEPNKKGGVGPTVVRPSTRGRAGKREKKKKIPQEDLPLERQRLYRVQKELVRLIQELPEYISFTVLSFNHEAKFIDDSPRLLPAIPENKKRAISWVNNMKAESETWTDTAFERALTELQDLDTIFLLSDGAPYRKGKAIPPEKVLAEIKTSNRFLKVRIHTIGFEQAGSNLKSFLKKVAHAFDGTYVELE